MLSTNISHAHAMSGPSSAGSTIQDLVEPILTNDLVAFFLSHFNGVDQPQALLLATIYGIKKMQLEGIQFGGLNVKTLSAVVRGSSALSSPSKTPTRQPFQDTSNKENAPTDHTPESSKKVTFARSSTPDRTPKSQQPKVSPKTLFKTLPLPTTPRALYPAWWGHREHIPTSQYSWLQEITTPNVQYTCPKRMVDEVTQTAVSYTAASGRVKPSLGETPQKAVVVVDESVTGTRTQTGMQTQTDSESKENSATTQTTPTVSNFESKLPVASTSSANRAPGQWFTIPVDDVPVKKGTPVRRLLRKSDNGNKSSPVVEVTKKPVSKPQKRQVQVSASPASKPDIKRKSQTWTIPATSQPQPSESVKPFEFIPATTVGSALPPNGNIMDIAHTFLDSDFVKCLDLSVLVDEEEGEDGRRVVGEDGKEEFVYV